MRNLSKTIVSEKATLINKELIMKKIIVVIAIVMAVFNTAVKAEIGISATTRYVLDTVPEVNVVNARRCAHAYHHGGTYRLMNDKVTLTCHKHQIRKEWDLPSN